MKVRVCQINDQGADVEACMEEVHPHPMQTGLMHTAKRHFVAKHLLPLDLKVGDILYRPIALSMRWGWAMVLYALPLILLFIMMVFVGYHFPEQELLVVSSTLVGLLLNFCLLRRWQKMIVSAHRLEKIR